MTAAMMSDALAASAAELVRAGLVTVPRLTFVRIPSELVHGVYNGKMPARSLLCHPDVWPSLKMLLPRVVWSDLTRTAESSLNRMIEKPGLVQPPSWSDHNVGGAGDAGVGESLKLGGFKNRRELDEFTTSCNFPMFWWTPGANAPAPNKPGSETYHRSWLDPSGIDMDGFTPGRSTAAMAERRMLRWYPWLDVSTWTDKARTAQYCLARLGHYHGAIDGAFGPLSRTALAMFQRALQVRSWCRKKGVSDFREGVLDKATARVLAFCAAERVVTEAP